MHSCPCKRQAAFRSCSQCRQPCSDRRVDGERLILNKKLQNANRRQDEFLARRVEAGDSEATRPRARSSEEVRLEPGPSIGSESREADVDGEGAEVEGGRLRAASTVSYATDRPRSRAPSTVTFESDRPVDPADDEMPVPTAEEQGAASSSGGTKRARDDQEGSDDRAHQYRQVEDPDPPPDEAGSLEVSEVLMLGQRRPPVKTHHYGRYDICELFSQARVTAEAKKHGMRGGWSLDISHVDEVTGETWDLSTEKDQRRVWKFLRRDKLLVGGSFPSARYSASCRIFSGSPRLTRS